MNLRQWTLIRLALTYLISNLHEAVDALAVEGSEDEIDFNGERIAIPDESELGHLRDKIPQ